MSKKPELYDAADAMRRIRAMPFDRRLALLKSARRQMKMHPVQMARFRGGKLLLRFYRAKTLRMEGA